MNEDKTGFIIFSSRRQLPKTITKHLAVNNSEIKRSDCIKYLGAHLDNNLSIKKHIATKCRTAMFNLLCIKNMLAMEACQTIMLGLVILHLNYVNATVAELPDLSIKMLQQIQNMVLERKLGIVLVNVYHCYTGYPSDRIKHKILTLNHSCIHK